VRPDHLLSKECL